LELGIVLFAFKTTFHVENLIILLAFQLEPSENAKTFRLDKWEKELIPLIQRYQTHLENKSVFDVISLDSTIEDVLEKPYIGPFNHQEHYDLIWVQDIYKRL
jgi:hypothetical protein